MFISGRHAASGLVARDMTSSSPPRIGVYARHVPVAGLADYHNGPNSEH
jgi:hypothetical protein